MKPWMWFLLGSAAGVAVVARLKPANESNCCRRVAFGVQSEIADRGGIFGGIVNETFDALGITKHLPRILDDFGVPLDA